MGRTKRIAWKHTYYHMCTGASGSPTQCSVKVGMHPILEGWDAERNRTGLQKGGDICIPVGDSC